MRLCIDKELKTILTILGNLGKLKNLHKCVNVLIFYLNIAFKYE